MSEWRVIICETRTGNIVAEVEPIDLPKFSRDLNGTGTVDVGVYLDQKHNKTVDFRTFTAVGKYSWAVVYDTYVCQAGPVWSYSYDETTHVLSVSCGGIQSIFNKRLLRNAFFGGGNITDISWDLSYTGSLSQIMLDLVTESLSMYTSPGNNAFMLPIARPSRSSLPSGTAQRNYLGYDLAKVWDRMEELTKVIDGPEIDFAPEFTDNSSKIQWRLNIGAPKLGDQNTTAIWEYGSAMESIDVDVNGSTSPVMRVWVKGTGSERDLITGYAEDFSLASQGYPPLEYVDTEHSSTELTGTLDGYAQADLEQFRNPVETWSCSVRIDGEAKLNGGSIAVSPRLGSFNLGDAPTVFVDNHPWIPNGGYRKRITGVSSDTQHTMKLDFEPGVVEL